MKKKLVVQTMYLQSGADMAARVRDLCENGHIVEHIVRTSPFRDPDMSGVNLADWMIFYSTKAKR